MDGEDLAKMIDCYLLEWLQTVDPPTLHVVYHMRSGSAKQSVNDGLGSIWQHGNFNTSQLRNISSYNVRRTHLPSLVGIFPLGVAPRIREI